MQLISVPETNSLIWSLLGRIQLCGGSCRVSTGHLHHSSGCIGIFFLVLLILCASSWAHLLLWTRFLDHPVKDKVVLVAHSVEKIFEQFSEVTDVRLLLKLETAAIVQIDAKLVR